MCSVCARACSFLAPRACSGACRLQVLSRPHSRVAARRQQMEQEKAEKAAAAAAAAAEDDGAPLLGQHRLAREGMRVWRTLKQRKRDGGGGGASAAAITVREQ